MNDLDIDLDRNTSWVDMSVCVKFGLDWPSRLAGHTEHRMTQTDKQTNKHNAFYYTDKLPAWYIHSVLFKWPIFQELLLVRPFCKSKFLGTVAVVHFTGQMPLLSPNQQHQSTEG